MLLNGGQVLTERACAIVVRDPDWSGDTEPRERSSSACCGSSFRGLRRSEVHEWTRTRLRRLRGRALQRQC